MGNSLPRTPVNRRENLTPLVLSSAWKSVTVQTHKNSKRYIHTLLIGNRHAWIITIANGDQSYKHRQFPSIQSFSPRGMHATRAICSACVNFFFSTHADRQGVDISVTVCLCVCFICVCVMFVRLRISPPRIKLAASNFARRFLCGVLGREFPILGNFAPTEFQNRTKRSL